MLQNAYYLLAKIGADTSENERNFAEISAVPALGDGGHDEGRAAAAAGPRTRPRSAAQAPSREPWARSAFST